LDDCFAFANHQPEVDTPAFVADADDFLINGYLAFSLPWPLIQNCNKKSIVNNLSEA